MAGLLGKDALALLPGCLWRDGATRPPGSKRLNDAVTAVCRFQGLGTGRDAAGCAYRAVQREEMQMEHMAC